MSIQNSRDCPLCGGRDGYSISNEVWDVVGLGPIEIGFRICRPCGLVLQDPVVPRERMLEHYSSFSNYTNPGRKGKPSRQKARNVRRQVEMVEKWIPAAGRAFQIGCSDGYTLSQFARRGWQVDGIDPSSSAREIARAEYGFTTQLGDFESADSLGRADLIIATHVLEHVYEPVSFLRKVASHLSDEGKLLIEVPCVVRPDRWPNGYFTFEHVQYFTPSTLSRCLALADFEITASEIHTEDLNYPILCVVAEPAEEALRQEIELDSDEYGRAVTLVREYQDREERTGWGRIEAEILPRLDRYESICVWGAGIHTSQLLARTNLSRRALRFIVDADHQKTGQRLAGFEISHPSRISPEEIDAVVISTYGSESAVYESTLDLREKGVDVIRLYAEQGTEHGDESRR